MAGRRRSRRVAVWALAVAVIAAGLVAVLVTREVGEADPDPGSAGPLPAMIPAEVIEVVDGDTVRVETARGRETVRLLGIDTPETVAPQRPVECFGPEASARAKELLPAGTEVVLELDPTQDQRDRYDRVLAYVHLDDHPERGPESVNRLLVEGGYAEAYVYERPFAYTDQFLASEREARDGDRGMWSACRDGDEGAALSRPDADGQTSACDPAYAGACVPVFPPDVDCKDVESDAVIRVVGEDRHQLDGDGDGIACG